MIEVKLIWPNAKLSPNARQHWAIKAYAVKKYRRECFIETKFQVPNVIKPEGRLTLEVEFYPPQRRAYDRDNLLARMKSGIDGMADALGINDKEFATVVVKVADQLGSFVMVRITGENDAKENQRPDGQGR
jgi:crossover junction endodeoxyribonuclease RusA